LEIHLDLIGGMAGDMFIAALLDAHPAHEGKVRDAIAATRGARHVTCNVLPHRDHILSGSRFEVLASDDSRLPLTANRGAPHEHVRWESIRVRLRESSLPARVLDHALEIFELLASAEGLVHGVAPDDVEFHEVGAWDSIADIVGAATLIDALDATRWSCSAVPLGSGRVDTAHGVLPVPTPATTYLLLGMPTLDDGVPGERVTPTGAAILRYLCPPNDQTRTRDRHARKLIASGTGFGSRELPGLSNHVRALCFEPSHLRAAEPRQLHMIEFEVDDQSGEELAAGLDRIRQHAGVADVTQAPVFGKKGRMMAQVRVLVRHGQLDEVISLCFQETTTIGLRHHSIEGVGLKRTLVEATIDGQKLRVKVVERPGQSTAKTESDDVLALAHHQRRASLRRRAEASVLDRLGDAVDA
jgi:uncharacterized protein (TIGR00299 family) protein